MAKYVVETHTGNRARRNRSHIHERTTTQNRVGQMTTDTHVEIDVPPPADQSMPETNQEHPQENADSRKLPDSIDTTKRTTRSGRVVRAPERYTHQWDKTPMEASVDIVNDRT